MLSIQVFLFIWISEDTFFHRNNTSIYCKLSSNTQHIKFDAFC